MKYIIVFHDIRVKLGLGFQEYCILDIVCRFQQNHVTPGWCYASKDALAEMLDISTRQLQRYVASLVEKGFIIRGDSSCLCVTEKWTREINAVDKMSWGAIKVTKGVSNMSDSGVSEMTSNSNINNKENNKKEAPSDLFGTKSDDSKKKGVSSAGKKILFKDCEIFDKEKFYEAFAEIKDMVDLEYYWHSADSWSSNGNKKIDWKKTIEQWMRRDNSDGKLRKLPTATDNSVLMDYLKM